TGSRGLASLARRIIRTSILPHLFNNSDGGRPALLLISGLRITLADPPGFRLTPSHSSIPIDFNPLGYKLSRNRQVSPRDSQRGFGEKRGLVAGLLHPCH